MFKISDEKRAYPRIKTNLRMNILENVFANLIDLSESGLSFSSTETISSPEITLKISFSDGGSELRTNAKLVWKRDAEGNSSLYGVEFVKLGEDQKLVLRKELVQNQISGLLQYAKDKDKKHAISIYFLKDVLDYINVLVKLTEVLAKEKDVSEKIFRRLTDATNLILLKGYGLEESLEDKILIAKVKENFRLLIGVWAYKSPFVKNGFEKPRGYPGDYLMLEAVYSNRPHAKGIGFCYDKYFLNSPYAVAVRYRKDKLREILKKYIKDSNQENLKIFNIACGSCREIKELPPEVFKGRKITFTCIDWDEEALAFSKQAVKTLPENVKFHFIKEDIFKIIKDSNFINSIGNQDLVYSIGLIDYLPDRILRMFIQFFYELTKEKGVLVLTHKNKEKTFSPLAPDWFCNWKFVSRNKEEVLQIYNSSGIKNFNLTTEVDEFNDIFYFYVQKEHGKKP
jgi:hypothetical protein